MANSSFSITNDIVFFVSARWSRTSLRSLREIFAEQKKRNREVWTRSKEGQGKVSYASSTDHDRHPEDPVTLLRQQLATKADKGHELRNKSESIEAANARILRNQMEILENFVKVMFLTVILLYNS